MVSSKLLRMFLDDASDACPQGQSVRVQFRLFETACRQALAGGSLNATGANGRHLDLAKTTERGSVTLLDVAEAWRRLIDVYDQSAADTLLPTDGSAEVGIKSQMLTYLREVLGYTGNFMYLSK